MKAIIQRDQIKLFQDMPDGHGGFKDYLQFDIRFTDYPALPTYGIRVDVTGLTTQQEIRDAIVPMIQERITKVLLDYNAWEYARNFFDQWGWSDTIFETDNL